MVRVRDNLVGREFGKLKVICQAEDYVSPTTREHVAQWLCECSCSTLRYVNLYSLCEQLQIATPSKKATKPQGLSCFFLVRVFITDLILRHSAEVVETYSQSAENACAYKEFCNTKGI